MGLIDTTFRELAKASFPDLLRYLLPDLLSQGSEVVELPQELPATVRATDLLVKAVRDGIAHRLVILECQAGREPDLQRLMLLRASLATFYYGLPTSTLLLALTPQAAVPERLVFAYLDDEPLEYAVKVRRIYEESADLALLHAPPALLPLCPIMRPENGDRSALLEQVLLKIAQLDLPNERRERLLTWASTFATLHLTSVQVNLICNDLSRRRPYMLQPLRDLPLLRDTYNEGVADGETKGKAEGKAESLLLLLEVRILPVTEEQRRRILSCQDVRRLDAWFMRALKGATIEEVLA